jgi:hypothetical protein
MQKVDRRSEQRNDKGLHKTLINCSLICEQGAIALEIINYHYRGACFKVTVGDYRIQSTKCHLQFKIGLSELPEKIYYRVVWETISENGLFGVEFSTESSFVLARAERFMVHKINIPVVSSQDPLDPNRIIYFRVENISTTGMLLSTSLSNKHLFPGMELRTALLTIPGIGKTDLSLFIENSRPAADEQIHFGVSLKGHSHSYHSLISKYLSGLGRTEEPEKRLDKLHDAKLFQRELRQHLTIFEVKTEAQYNEVLKLRFDGYKKAGKIDSGKSWRDMGDGLSNEGVILAASLGGQLVASCELRINRLHGLRISQKVSLEQIEEIRTDNLFEINKLVIHPKAQNSDIVLGIIQKIHSLVMLNGYPDGIILADSHLVSLYERIGFKKTKIAFPHPVRENLQLHVLILRKESYLKSDQLNPYAWSVAYEETEKFFQSIGLNNDSGLKTPKILMKNGTEFLLRFAKMRKKKSALAKGKKRDEAPTGKIVIDPKWTKQHLNVNVILPYLLVAIEMIGDEKVRHILLEMGLDLSYFSRSSNWVSVDFFDYFIDRF